MLYQVLYCLLNWSKGNHFHFNSLPSIQGCIEELSIKINPLQERYVLTKCNESRRRYCTWYFPQMQRKSSLQSFHSQHLLNFVAWTLEMVFIWRHHSELCSIQRTKTIALTKIKKNKLVFNLNHNLTMSHN